MRHALKCAFAVLVSLAMPAAAHAAATVEIGALMIDNDAGVCRVRLYAFNNGDRVIEAFAGRIELRGKTSGALNYFSFDLIDPGRNRSEELWFDAPCESGGRLAVREIIRCIYQAADRPSCAAEVGTTRLSRNGKPIPSIPVELRLPAP